jgi:hypothetical protein
MTRIERIQQVKWSRRLSANTGETRTRRYLCPCLSDALARFRCSIRVSSVAGSKLNFKFRSNVVRAVVRLAFAVGVR